MIVYVETNFVLEQVFLQDEHGSCTRLLAAAQSKSIELVLPAYSLGEPYEKLIRRQRERKQLSERVRQELHELGRSAPYANKAAQHSDLVRLLIDSNEQENQRLNETLKRILEIATIIPTDADVLRNALLAQHDLGLSPQDSIVYAAVRKHLIQQDGPRCFINKNTKDFMEPRVAAEFKTHHCKLIPGFSDGISYIEAYLRRRDDTPSGPNNALGIPRGENL